MILIVKKTDDLNRSALNESKKFKQSIVTVTEDTISCVTQYFQVLHVCSSTHSIRLTVLISLLNHCK